MRFYVSVSVFMLTAALVVGSGCRRRKQAPPPPVEPSAEPAAVTPAPTVAPIPAPAAPTPAATAPVREDTFKTSSEFDDLNKDFLLYCNFKKRVPADINEFFRDQKIKPPAVPPGTRLAIDPVGKRIILVK